MDKSASLPEHVQAVIRDKGTERPHTGEYNDYSDNGTYICRQCGLALFRAKHKFHSGCGWPSFDNEIEGTVKRLQDSDGERIEILCSRCDAHLGHVFEGEGFTEANTRHCVNSTSLEFVPDLEVRDTEEAIFAAGCFWGVEYFFQKLKGVLKTQVGYTGGSKDNPTYDDVCRGDTGHYEAIRVIYNPEVISYEDIVKYFFEIHNFSQDNGQGPDIGHQYLSAIFVYDEKQREIAEALISRLQQMDYGVSTSILPVNVFWPAEVDHQKFYEKKGSEPYCHTYTKIFK